MNDVLAEALLLIEWLADLLTKKSNRDEVDPYPGTIMDALNSAEDFVARAKGEDAER